MLRRAAYPDLAQAARARVRVAALEVLCALVINRRSVGRPPRKDDELSRYLLEKTFDLAGKHLPAELAGG